MTSNHSTNFAKKVVSHTFIGLILEAYRKVSFMVRFIFYPKLFV
jgi:hypothetical protein